jgi:hypothetical protein
MRVLQLAGIANKGLFVRCRDLACILLSVALSLVCGQPELSDTCGCELSGDETQHHSQTSTTQRRGCLLCISMPHSSVPCAQPAQTAIVGRVAHLLGYEVERINLGGSTTLDSLFGAIMPRVDELTGQRTFVWHDGSLVRAIKAGRWVSANVSFCATVYLLWVNTVGAL